MQLASGRDRRAPLSAYSVGLSLKIYAGGCGGVIGMVLGML